jgi:murein DD-endopeptidase MepM/ murein hydrolase activator NlpD
MKKLKWNFIVADVRNSENMRTFRISGFVVLIGLIAALVGLVGFGRLVYMTSSYALAVFDASERRNENEGLKKKIESLEKFVTKETETISQLVAYEDNARLKYGMEAISSDVRKAGVGGLPSNDDILFASMLDPLIVRAESLRLQVTSLYHRAELQESTFGQLTETVQKMDSRWSKRPAIWPTNGRLTSNYGYRIHPFTGMRLLHEGLDIANAIWTPVYATADGLVKDVSTQTYFGNVVRINHNNGEFMTLYAHMQKAAVITGQAVKRGDVVGYIGNTGRSTGPHLHYEVRRNGSVVNPMAFIVAVDQIVD